jgi:hypothetical protein
MKRAVLTVLLLAVVLSLPTICLAQDFIVNLQGDTIKGEVKALAFGPEKKVQITEPGKKKALYPFFKVKSFSVDGELYQPVKGPSGYTFMKLLKSGYLSLYAFQPENQNSYDAMFLLKRDGEGIEVPNLTFKKGMRRFLDDCPVVAGKIENDMLNKRDINQIVDEYNACISDRTNAPAPTAAVAKPATAVKKNTDVWNALEQKVKAQPDFAEKENALDMINEIKNKVAADQKIPNFLAEGLKGALDAGVFNPELENALKTIN